MKLAPIGTLSFGMIRTFSIYAFFRLICFIHLCIEKNLVPCTLGMLFCQNELEVGKFVRFSVGWRWRRGYSTSPAVQKLRLSQPNLVFHVQSYNIAVIIVNGSTDVSV